MFGTTLRPGRTCLLMVVVAASAVNQPRQAAAEPPLPGAPGSGPESTSLPSTDRPTEAADGTRALAGHIERFLAECEAAEWDSASGSLQLVSSARGALAPAADVAGRRMWLSLTLMVRRATDIVRARLSVLGDAKRPSGSRRDAIQKVLGRLHEIESLTGLGAALQAMSDPQPELLAHDAILNAITRFDEQAMRARVDASLARLDTYDGTTLFTWACAEGHPFESLRLLVELGADPAHVDGDGRTCAQSAAARGHDVPAELAGLPIVYSFSEEEHRRLEATRYRASARDARALSSLHARGFSRTQAVEAYETHRAWGRKDHAELEPIANFSALGLGDDDYATMLAKGFDLTTSESTPVTSYYNRYVAGRKRLLIWGIITGAAGAAWTGLGVAFVTGLTDSGADPDEVQLRRDAGYGLIGGGAAILALGVTLTSLHFALTPPLAPDGLFDRGTVDEIDGFLGAERSRDQHAGRVDVLITPVLSRAMSGAALSLTF